jgi:acetyl esterase/lipase
VLAIFPPLPANNYFKFFSKFYPGMSIGHCIGLKRMLAAIMVLISLSMILPTAMAVDASRSHAFEQIDKTTYADLTIPGGPTGHINVRIIRPIESSETLPVVMYYHGGGWAGGDIYTHDRLIRKLASKTNAAVVFVEYSLSPGVRYPVAIEEAYHAMKYIADNGRQLNLDSSRLAVAGDSAGGNMAAVMAILAKQRNGPKIMYQVLFYPVTDANFDTPSYHRFASGYQLDRDTMKSIWDNYLPDKNMRKEPAASPLQAPVDLLKGLPPALVITAEQDVLRDEGEAYASKLAKAGVPTTGVQYLGMVHGFVIQDAFMDTPATYEAIDLASSILSKAFKSTNTGNP